MLAAYGLYRASLEHDRAILERIACAFRESGRA
jgi:hypothetical protein